MPKDVLLTFALDAHPSWLAFPTRSVHDLDNIRLADVKAHEDVNARLQLRNIIVEGHCRETATNQPPRGLELELLAYHGTSKVDSLYASALRLDMRVNTDTCASVMANLGYVQLKANPGVYTLALRSGRSSDIYSIDAVGADGFESRPVNETGSLLALTTFEGLTIYPRFQRNPGMETADLLADLEPTTPKAKNLASQIASR